MPAASYYDNWYQESSVPGVNPALADACKSLGLWIEWYDPGTLHAFYDNPVYATEARKAETKYKVASKRQILQKKSPGDSGLGISR